MAPRTLVLAWIAVAAAGACARGPEAPASKTPYTAEVRFGTGDAVLHVAIARTQPEKERGLMHVQSLPRGAGMAFVWSRPTAAPFWMKDTRIPLSIAFVDERGRIRAIREMTPCSSDPCRLYRANGPFTVAIEANAGWFDANGVGVGDRVSVEPSG